MTLFSYVIILFFLDMFWNIISLFSVKLKILVQVISYCKCISEIGVKKIDVEISSELVELIGKKEDLKIRASIKINVFRTTMKTFLISFSMNFWLFLLLYHRNKFFSWVHKEKIPSARTREKYFHFEFSGTFYRTFFWKNITTIFIKQIYDSCCQLYDPSLY